MRRQRSLALLAVLASCGGVSACGSDEELSTQVPKTSPDLTIPTGTTAAREDDTGTTATTSTTDTSTTAATPQGGVAPPAPVTPPAAPTPPPATGSPQTGGQAPNTGGQSTTGGAQAGGGEFESFCAENPGAC
jgi:hypothetical protein